MKKGNTVIGKKVKERWYPIYAPHIILGTNKSILDYINNGKKGKERWYPMYAPHIILGTNKSILDYIDNGTDTSR